MELREDAAITQIEMDKDYSILNMTKVYDPLVMLGATGQSGDFMERENPISNKFFNLI